MPSASKKIAAAIRSANRAIVNNYNAANRAVNRAPKWVKWTVGIVAVAVILYVLWKLMWPKKEGFTSGGVTYEEKTDTMVKFDYPGFEVFSGYNINNKETGMTGMVVQDAGGMPQYYDFGKDGGRILDLTERLERAAYFCNRTLACSGFQLNPEGGVYYLGPKILSQDTKDLATSPGYKIFTKKATEATGPSGGPAAGPSGGPAAGPSGGPAGPAMAPSAPCDVKYKFLGVEIRGLGGTSGIGAFVPEVRGAISTKTAEECCRLVKEKSPTANGYLFKNYIYDPNAPLGRRSGTQCWGMKYTKDNMFKDIAVKDSGHETGIFGAVSGLDDAKLKELHDAIGTFTGTESDLQAAYNRWKGSADISFVTKCTVNGGLTEFTTAGFDTDGNDATSINGATSLGDCCRLASENSNYNGYVYKQTGGISATHECWGVKFTKQGLLEKYKIDPVAQAGIFKDHGVDLDIGKLAESLKNATDTKGKEDAFANWKRDVGGFSTSIPDITRPDFVNKWFHIKNASTGKYLYNWDWKIEMRSDKEDRTTFLVRQGHEPSRGIFLGAKQDYWNHVVRVSNGTLEVEDTWEYKGHEDNDNYLVIQGNPTWKKQDGTMLYRIYHDTGSYLTHENGNRPGWVAGGDFKDMRQYWEFEGA